MEYEQLENGRKVVLEAIKQQDVSGYYDILAPDVILISHFPYPHVGPHAAAAASPAMAAMSDISAILHRRSHPNQRTRQLLREQPELLARQAERYRVHLEQMEAGSPSAGPLPPTTAAAETSAVPTAPAAAPVPPEAPSKTTDRHSRSRPAARGGAVSGRAGGAALSHPPPGLTLYLADSPPADPHDAAAEAAGGPHGRRSYGEGVDVVEGPRLVAERFGYLLAWMGLSRYIAEVRVQLDARKGILHDSEVLPPPPPPTTEAERYALLGSQYTDRNQRLSRLTVHWGREYLQLVDQCFFVDGLIVTIHRRLLRLPEMLERLAPGSLSPAQQAERVQREVRDFYGVNHSRVASTNPVWPLLDYSFQTVENPAQLFQVLPLSGRIHVARGFRPALDPHLAQGVFLNELNDPTKDPASGRTLVKARNKQGDEEAYEFDRTRERFALVRATEENLDTTFEVALRARERCYDATSVRIASCRLGDHMERLIPALRGLVANAFLTIHSLDLSDNRIRTLPDFSALPLQKLQLHGNRIDDWSEVEAKVCPLPFLFALTLHGNPFSESSAQYWPLILSRLLRHPNRQVRLKQLDFVTLTAQDYNVAGAFDLFTTGDKTLLKAAAKESHRSRMS